jgi:outer membrane protein
MTTKLLALGTAAAAALALAGAAQAETQAFQPKEAGHFMLNVRVTDVMGTGRDPLVTLAGAPTGLQSKVENDVMPTIGISYFFTDNIAAEVILGTTRHSIRAQGPGVDVQVRETWVLPPVLSLQYHFMPKERFSPYVGAGVNYMLFYGGKDRNGFHFKVNNGFGAALQAGADYAISGPWSANVDVKKIFFETTAKDEVTGIKTKVSLDPWVISAGVGYKF